MQQAAWHTFVPIDGGGLRKGSNGEAAMDAAMRYHEAALDGGYF
jgi:hypothetical protein